MLFFLIFFIVQNNKKMSSKLLSQKREREKEEADDEVEEEDNKEDSEAEEADEDDDEGGDEEEKMPEKRAKKAKTTPSVVPAAAAGGAAAAVSFRNRQFASKGLLIVKETDDYTYYLTQEDLKSIIENVSKKERPPGKYIEHVSKNTHIFIEEGALDREFTKKCADTWKDSKTKTDLDKALKSDHPPVVMKFVDFMKAFKVERECFDECHIASFKDKKGTKKIKPPGKQRNRGSLMSYSLIFTSGPHSTNSVKPKHDPFTYSFY